MNFFHKTKAKHASELGWPLPVHLCSCDTFTLKDIDGNVMFRLPSPRDDMVISEISLPWASVYKDETGEIIYCNRVINSDRVCEDCDLRFQCWTSSWRKENGR